MNKLIPTIFLSMLVVGCSVPPASPEPPATSAPTSAKPTPQAPTQAPAVPTSTPALVPTPVPTAPGGRVLVQVRDNSVVLIDASGSVTLLGKAPVRLSGSPFAAAVAGNTVFGISADKTPGVFSVDAAGAKPLASVGTNNVGVSAWQGLAPEDARLAWGGNYTITADGRASAHLLITSLDGASARVMLTHTTQGIPSTLLPLRWSADGKTLVYSVEPTGLGGYIPFGGFSSLYTLEVASGVTRTLIPRSALGFICLDDLSADFGKVAYHCGDQAIHVLDLSANQTATINIPAPVKDAAALGSASFSPDSARVAFAMARRDPENEQGWLAVSGGLSGASSVVYTSTAGAYIRVAGWLDASTIVFQLSPVGGSSNAPETVWAVGADGSNLRQLTEGALLAVVGKN